MYVLSGIFLVALIWLATNCKKQEYVIVYSKVKTVRVYDITTTTASVEGSIDSLTSAAHDEFGFCMDTLSGATVYKQKFPLTGTVKLGSFSGTLSNLKPSKTYYIKAFIKDNKKYIYGKEVLFTTSAAVLPVVTTNSVDNILGYSATCGGYVTSEGDSPVTAKGVCYDTIAEPTIIKKKTMDGWGIGSYSSAMLNLVPNKTYYVKAYAVSGYGVSYGSQKTFTTKAKFYSMHEEFSDNSRKWDVSTFSGGNATIANGYYTITYQEQGYLYLMYINFPDFKSIASKDFEINTSINLDVNNPLNLSSPVTLGGLVWDSDDTHFKYFIIRKNPGSGGTFTYQYAIGAYSSSYTTWKDYTSFTAGASTKLSIKKANSKYYFFIDDVQVFSYDYSTISYEGVGFLVEDGIVKADYLYFDQKAYRKSAETDELKTLPGGHFSFKASGSR